MHAISCCILLLLATTTHARVTMQKDSIPEETKQITPVVSIPVIDMTPQNTTPSGTYKGTGNNRDLIITINSNKTLAFFFTNKINCPSEEYEYDASSGAITLVHWGTSSDCLTEAFYTYRFFLSDTLSLRYEANKDVIEVTLKIGIFQLTKSAIDMVDENTALSTVETATAPEPNTTPSGTYQGKVGVAHIEVTVKSATSASFQVTFLGQEIFCPSEEYKYDASSGAITLVHWGTSSDCLTEAFKRYASIIGHSLSLRYEANKDVIELTLKLGTFQLTKSATIRRTLSDGIDALEKEFYHAWSMFHSPKSHKEHHKRHGKHHRKHGKHRKNQDGPHHSFFSNFLHKVMRFGGHRKHGERK